MQKSFLNRLRELLLSRKIIILSVILSVSACIWGLHSHFFQYIYTRVIWVLICKDELAKLNPQAKDSINNDVQITWSPGNVFFFLYPNNKEITNLTPLNKLSMITFLCLDANVKDLNFIKEMEQLKVISLTCPIENISAIQGKKIEVLSMDGTKLRDISPLRGMKLRIFSLTNSPFVENINVLSTMEIKHLVLDNLKIKDITALKTCKKLESFSCNNCPIRDLSPLEGHSITHLSIENTLVDDLTPLLKLRPPEKLNCLYFTGTPAARKPLPNGLAPESFQK